MISINFSQFYKLTKMASNLSQWASLCADTHCNIKLVEIKFCLTINVFRLVFVSIAKKIGSNFI